MASLWFRIVGRRRRADSVEELRLKVAQFRDLVEKNNLVLELIADAGEKLGGEYIFDIQYLRTLARNLSEAVRRVASDVNDMTGNRYPALLHAVTAIEEEVRATLESRVLIRKADLVTRVEDIDEAAMDMAGEKMGRLGEIRKRIGCRIPDGFVVSTYACQRLLEGAGIDRDVDGWLASAKSGVTAEIDECSARLQERILDAAIPRDLARAIRRETERLTKKGRYRQLAVRSSAIGEDGEWSFAGQYKTLLGVPPSQVSAALKEVLASLYSSDVATYRHRSGLGPSQGAMAVGCLGMIEARAGGVIYTLDPQRPGEEVLLVTAARGLGKPVVEGSGVVDRFDVSRTPPHAVLARSVGRKTWMYVAEPGQGLRKVAIAESSQAGPAVTDAELAELARTAVSIERYMKCAQDIEWSVDSDGRLFILQARPLRISDSVLSIESDMTGIAGDYPVLLSNQGIVACRGIASGRVHVVQEDDDLDSLPDDVVLVARTSTPRLAAAIARARAVITDVGTSTGHLAAVAREFRVPTIVDTETATRVLRGAGEVTVDAESNVVYEGRVSELLRYQLLRQSSYEDATEFRLLRKMLGKIAPLNLKDPQSPNFSPQHCHTYHDIIRFSHEKAVEELIEGCRMIRTEGSAARRLTLGVPLDLVLIDLGGGLRPGIGMGPATIEDVHSAPLSALLEGLTGKGVWGTGPAAMDLDGFMSSATRSAVLTGPLAASPQQNLAIISERYLNLNLKLGYHFNIVDCYLSEIRNDNFIYFRFGGGVTELARRSRRAVLLKQILQRHDFVVEGTHDLVIGRIKKIASADMVERLRMIGRLIGFTRQLDIFLRDDDLVERYVDDFMKGRVTPSSS